MRPTWERPTIDSRSNSSKEPVAFAKARRRRSRRNPSGRFISKRESRAEGYAPGRKAHRHGNGYRALVRYARKIGERAATFAVTVEQPRLSGVGPDFDHRDSLAS